MIGCHWQETFNTFLLSTTKIFAVGHFPFMREMEWLSNWLMLHFLLYKKETIHQINGYNPFDFKLQKMIFFKRKVGLEKKWK